MKTKCTEGSDAGEMVTLNLFMPEEEDELEVPVFSIDCLSLLAAVEEGIDIPTAGCFDADALSVLMWGVSDAASAENLAKLLEGWAAAVRAKFPPSSVDIA